MSGSKSFWVYSGGMDLTAIALEYAIEKAQIEKVIYVSASKKRQIPAFAMFKVEGL